MPAAAPASKHTNRLIHETSPYLLQHAHNPVDWYAWGEEAFEAARLHNKPIFLSIGYSTCYWCHVMERQCFENEQIAREMNHRFINIKVDREERPDVDQLYMTAVQVLSKHGGWPLNVFLTPDLRPFYGGTYFPPTDVYGRPGFLTVLRAIEDSYRNRLADVEQTCEQLLNIIQQLAEPQPPAAPITIGKAFVDDLVERSIADYDPKLGGFGAAPKFPRQTLLEMLLVYLRELPPNLDPQSPLAQRKMKVLEILQRTLDAMADGGIHDHLGGGFHRYSTDAEWLVPHFEIMLYDNAMLAWVYAEAHRQTAEPRYAAIARGILDFILRQMTSPQGAFYTAFDAEVDAMEGQSYLWTADEIRSILGQADAALFSHVYGVDRGPNFADPHQGTGQPDKNILYLPQPLATAVGELGLSPLQLDEKLLLMRQRLYDARRQRKQPLLDTKIITGWNALTIRALAFAGRVLPEPRYIDAAARAADFLLEHHSAPDSGLWRTSRDGMPKHSAFVEDYAFLAQALLELSRCDGHNERKEQARDLVVEMLERFGDQEPGGLYFTEDTGRDILVRQKVASDSPLPSGNSVAAMCLMELEQESVARDIICAFASQLESMPDSMSAMLQAATLYLKRRGPITVSLGPWRGQSEQRPPSPDQIAAGVISVEAIWQAPDELHLRLTILDNFHINTHEDTPHVNAGPHLKTPHVHAGPHLTPTTLTVTGSAAAEIEAIDYPPGEEERFSFSDVPIRTYRGTVLIAIRFKRPMQAREPVALSLHYQACTLDACFPPISKPIEVVTP